MFTFNNPSRLQQSKPGSSPGPGHTPFIKQIYHINGKQVPGQPSNRITEEPSEEIVSDSKVPRISFIQRTQKGKPFEEIKGKKEPDETQEQEIRRVFEKLIK